MDFVIERVAIYIVGATFFEFKFLESVTVQRNMRFRLEV